MRGLLVCFAVLAVGCSEREEAISPRPTATLARSPYVPSWDMTSVSLYLPEQVMEERVETAALASYIEALKQAAVASFAVAPPAAGVTGSIVFVVAPDDRHAISIVAGSPGLPKALKQAMTERLIAVRRPQVSGGPIMASVNFDAWGGGAPPLNMPTPLPEVWVRLLPDDGGYIDDGFIERLLDAEKA